MLRLIIAVSGVLASLIVGQDYLPSPARDALASLVPPQIQAQMPKETWTPHAPEDFDEAKRMLWDAWSSYPVEIYCGCVYEGRKPRSDCPVQSPVFQNRLDVIEWEHVVPAGDFYLQRPCYRQAPDRDNARGYCRETDQDFRKMEADPHNLRPSVGALNAIRRNYRYGEVPGEERKFGGCDFETSNDGEGRFVEPPENMKGDVSRVYFYMEWRYGLRIGKSQRRLFDAWNRMDPIDQAERAMHAQVAIRTHTCNYFIDGPEIGLPCPPRPH